MLPEGWRNTIISEACELINGRGFKPHEWSRKGLPIIRIQNLNGSQEYNFYSGEFDKKILVQDGQLLFAWSGSKGTSFGPHIWNGPNGLLNYHTWKVLPKPSANILFLNQYFRYITSHIENKSHGASALVHTQKGEMENISILLPPLPEQKKIAAILSTWDRAIEGTEKLLANSQQQKKALMQQLLTGKKRLPGFTGEWKLSPISAFIKESRVSGNSGDIAKKITIKLYGKGVFPKEEKREGSESTKYYKRKSGQFIYSKLDFLNGAFGIIPPSLDGYESTLDLPAFDFLHNVSSQWFIFYVSREEFYSANLGLANGGRKARRVNPSDLLRISVPTPSLPEQKAIAAVLSTADEEITAIESDLSRLRQEKKALMQQLLTGKRRVRVD